MKIIFNKYLAEILLGLFIVLYIGYFSYFSILRYQTLYSHYFDLGIMNQTVYNTFMSIKTGDFTRFLEMTNPHGFDQVKRMAVHNDIFLAFLAPLYFIFAGPETLLLVQSIATGLGALALFGIGKEVFSKHKNSRGISLFFACVYLLYPPLQFANQFDFHAVVFATPLFLLMYLAYLKRKYWMGFICAILILLTKEQAGLTVAFFGMFVGIDMYLKSHPERKKNAALFALTLFSFGVGWFILSMTTIIPYFRSDAHFALSYFGEFGDTPSAVFIGLAQHPSRVVQYLLSTSTFEYIIKTLGPVGYLSLLSPLYLAIAAPEYAINLLSGSGAMRNIYFHYTAIITPFVFISAIYGFNTIEYLVRKVKKSRFIILLFVGAMALYFSFTHSPLPYSATKEVKPFLLPVKERNDAFVWRKILIDDSIKVMATGKMGPLFSSRRYFYNFSERYDLADYVVLFTDDVYNGYEREKLIPAYERLVKDNRFITIYKNETFIVYKKI